MVDLDAFWKLEQAAIPGRDTLVGEPYLLRSSDKSMDDSHDHSDSVDLPP